MATLRVPAAIVEADLDRHFPAILELYRAHGWVHAADPARLRRAVDNSSLSIVAVADDEVVGYARVLSDGEFAVYIADILVRPDRQRHGIGSALFLDLLERFPIDRFHHQVLMSERGAEGFYRKHGLMPVTTFGLTAFIRTRDGR